MGIKKVSSASLVLFFCLISFSFTQEFKHLKILPQNFLTKHSLDKELQVFSNNLSFEQIISAYMRFYSTSQLLRRTETLYVSTLPYLRRKLLRLFSDNSKQYKQLIKKAILEYIKKDDLLALFKILYIVPVNTAFKDVWAEVVKVYIEDGNCYVLRYLSEKFNIYSLFPRLFSVVRFCYNVSGYGLSHKVGKQKSADKEKLADLRYSFTVNEYPLKGSIELIEDLSAARFNRNFFANYGFTKIDNNLYFHNGNSLYELTLQNDKFSVEKALDGLSDLESVYTFEYDNNKKDYLISNREIFDLVVNKNYLFGCFLSEKEQGQSKIIVRDNIFFENIAYSVPMKYPRFFRNFVIFDAKKRKIEYFYSGDSKSNSLEKFSCQNIALLNNRFVIVSGVYGEKKEPYSHYLLKFDVLNRRVLWKTFLISGFMERNLFGNSVYESWSSPINCDATSCIFSNDMGVVASVDHISGNINWILSIPSYRFKATLTPQQFDKLPYFSNNKQTVISHKNILVQTVSNPAVYKIESKNNIPIVSIFDGNISEKTKHNQTDTMIGFENYNYYINSPRFLFTYKENAILIYDSFVKIKDILTGKQIYELQLLSTLNGKPVLFNNLLLIPLLQELIIISLNTFKILYQENINRKKLLGVFFDNKKIYVLFKNTMWVISFKLKIE